MLIVVLEIMFILTNITRRRHWPKLFKTYIIHPLEPRFPWKHCIFIYATSQNIHEREYREFVYYEVLYTAEIQTKDNMIKKGEKGVNLN